MSREAKRNLGPAKLSLNIISLSLVHYLFNKLLRDGACTVHGQEVTHYAFYDKARATMRKINEGKNRKGGEGME